MHVTEGSFGVWTVDFIFARYDFKTFCTSYYVNLHSEKEEQKNIDDTLPSKMKPGYVPDHSSRVNILSIVRK